MSEKDQDAEMVQASVKKILAQHQAWLKEHFADSTALELLSANTEIFDRILKMAFPVFAEGMTERISLVALGSYGRGEVCPHSDLDLLILYQDLSMRKLEDFSNRILSLLWDQKIQVGHSIRTIEQSLKISEKDYSVLTSLLDSRLVAGSKELFKEMQERFEKMLAQHRRDYFNSKLSERRVRQMKFREEIWLTEPYLMEGTGGLRDWHLINWFSKACIGEESESVLLKLKIATPEEIRELYDGVARLFRVRAALHFISGEKTDHLRIEYQDELAGTLKLKPRKAEERADALLAYVLSGAEIVARTLERLVRELRKGFEGQKAEQSFIYELDDKAKKGSFPDILNLEHSATLIKNLRLEGLLRAKFPELDSAFFTGQRDGYHIFTVGWHSVRCVERLEGFSSEPEFGDDPEINWRILKLAGLIHDLGKGFGSDHCKSGAELSRRIGKKFHLGEDSELLEFLVREHMLLNYYAQRRDFYEPKAIESLLKKIRDRSRLKMLYILTIADIQAVSDLSWTGWKAELLKALYHLLLAHIEKRETPSALVQRRIQELSKLIKARGLSQNLIQGLQSLPTRYLLGTNPEKLIEQMELAEARSQGEVIIKIQKLEKPRLELIVVCDDHPGLFSEMSGVLSALNYNILSAEINTLKENTALDIFLLEDLVAIKSERWSIEMESRAEALKQTLIDAINGRIKVPELILKKRGLFKPKSRLKICPEAQADQESSPDYTILEVQAMDQQGLLYKITRLIFEHGLDIHFAKISTRSEKVFDVFYLRDPSTGGKASGDKISALVSSLCAGLDGKK